MNAESRNKFPGKRNKVFYRFQEPVCQLDLFEFAYLLGMVCQDVSDKVW